MSPRKTILWVEDFSNVTALADDMFSDEAPDRSEQIREIFPPYLVDRVQVIEDPTRLPAYMKEHSQDCEFILLDVNFEDGISQLSEDLDPFLAELQDAHLNVSRLSWEVIRRLGYHLYTYLQIKWHIPYENMAFYSAYCTEDDVRRLDELTSLSVHPLRFDKRNRSDLTTFLENRYSSSQLGSEHSGCNGASAAISAAKSLFAYWKLHGISKDSLLNILCNPDSGQVENNLSFLEKTLNSIPTGGDDTWFSPIFDDMVDPFQQKIHGSYHWGKPFLYTYKHMRNLYKHRKNLHSELSPCEFLLLYTIALRLICDSCAEPTELLDDERWLIDGIHQITNQKSAASADKTPLSANQLLVLREETLFSWYMPLASKAGFLASSSNLLYDGKTSIRYTLKDMIRLLCMQSLNARLTFSPYMPDFHTPQPPQPSIRAVMSFETTPGHHSGIPTAISELGLAYLDSQLETPAPLKPFSFSV